MVFPHSDDQQFYVCLDRIERWTPSPGVCARRRRHQVILSKWTILTISLCTTIPFVCRKNFDWGLYSIDTTIDRKEFCQKTILAIIHFGDHALHHLFPTLDHAVLPHLYDILFETLNEFEAEAKAYSFWKLISGQFQQLARVKPMEKCSHIRFKAQRADANWNDMEEKKQ